MRRRIKKIVIHCSDSPHRGDTAEDVHKWHLQRGWSGIGYHYTITEKGILEAGRPHYWIGSHVSGHNTDSIGIMLFGTTEFTTRQMDTLEEVVRFLLAEYPKAKVYGHTDLNSYKTCPNFDVLEWCEDRGIT